jgi:acyl-CoA reductase-like NAD-dependent aldehyde dehydrogenase
MMQQIRREALGTIMCIAPWNYPLITLVNTLVAGVLAGNTVLIKHSPYTATIGKQFEKAFAAEQNIVTDLAIDIPTCQ